VGVISLQEIVGALLYYHTSLQKIVGALLYYHTHTVDSTLLVAIGTLASAQAQGTEATVEIATHLLNYYATYPDSFIRYHTSDMCLHIHSNASHLSERKAKSRSSGYNSLAHA
jgi:uncharacterized membrane protein